MNNESYLQALALPLILLAIVLLAFISWEVLGLPSEGELLESTEDIFLKYGLYMVALGAFLEALMFVGWYVPGGTVVLLGVIFAGDDLERVIMVVVLGTLGLLAGYFVNYVLGKYGWYRLGVKLGLASALSDAKRRLEKQGARAIFFTYWQPGFASLTSTAAGILGYPLKKFLLYSLAALVFWDSVWGFIAFNFGDEALEIVSLKLILAVLLFWIAWTLAVRWRNTRYAR